METKKIVPKTYRLYSYRWLTLALFCSLSFSNAFLWITYACIPLNVLSAYHNVSDVEINLMSVIYMIMYIPLVFPATFVVENPKWGNLRMGVLIGALLNMVGAAFRYWGATERSGFWIAFFGQTLAAIAQAFILAVPPRLAAVWFGSSERNMASSIGVVANNVGSALPFLISSKIIADTGKIELDIANAILSYPAYMLTQFIVCTIIFISILIFFKAEPPTSPSNSTEHAMQNQGHFLKNMKHLLLEHCGFLYLFLSYGIAVGTYYAMSTLLFQILNPIFPTSLNMIEWLGFIMTTLGIIGTLGAGYFLDKIPQYRALNLILFGLNGISLAFFCLGTELRNIQIVYIFCIFFGMSVSGIVLAGFQYGSEITYPVSEIISGGLLNCSAQLFGIFITLGMTVAKIENSEFPMQISIYIMMSVLTLGVVFAMCVKGTLHRVALDRENSNLSQFNI